MSEDQIRREMFSDLPARSDSVRGTRRVESEMVISRDRDSYATEIHESVLYLEVADVAYSYTIPDGTRGIEVYCRQNNVIRYSFRNGIVETTTRGREAGWRTIGSGQKWRTPVGVKLTGQTLYFATWTAGDVLEITAWN